MAEEKDRPDEVNQIVRETQLSIERIEELMETSSQEVTLEREIELAQRSSARMGVMMTKMEPGVVAWQRLLLRESRHLVMLALSIWTRLTPKRPNDDPGHGGNQQ